jgi:hypothetical protein
MSKVTLILKDSFVPPNVRPYWTFRNATAVVSLATVATALVRALVRFPPEYVAKMESQNSLHSPVFLSLFYVLVAFVLWGVYATRHRESWYVWRVTVFGMVMAGACIAALNIMLPLRAF